jgi:hypothetical protein
MRGIRHLCDHRGILYRATVTRDALGDTIETWVQQTTPAGKNCRPNQAWSGDQQDHGPGEQQGAKRQWFLRAGFAPKDRDVLSVVTGPEAETLLRILSVTSPTDPKRVHHIEVNVEVWQGSLT